MGGGCYAGGVVKEVIRELAEEVSTLPTPTLLLIRTMAGRYTHSILSTQNEGFRPERND